MAILRRGALALALLWTTSATAAVNAAGAGTDAATADPRLFPQTGYRVDRDDFWNFFQKRGGVRTFGYPTSREAQFQGCATQFFQRIVLQRCGSGGVRPLNLLDGGLLPYARINGSTFPTADPALAKAAPSPTQPGYGDQIMQFVRANAPDTFEGERVNFLQTFLGTVRAEDAFPSGGSNPDLLPLLNLEMWGAPISRPQRDPANRNFIYQRFQRGIMHYDRGCGCTQGLLLADYLKGIVTGQNLPADLEAQARTSPLYRVALAGQGTLAAAFGFPMPAFQAVVSVKPVSETEKKAFIDRIGEIARRLRTEVGLPPSLVVSIAINETGWGQSALAKQANNYFGIKAHRGPGNAGSVEMDTWEMVDGQRVPIKAPFRAYTSVEESVRDLGRFLRSSPRYEAVWKAGGDPVVAARAMLAAGYATDPAWPDKLAGHIDRYGLRRLDS